MLVVKLEIHHGGDSQRVERLGELRLINVAELAPVSDYAVRLVDAEGKPIGRAIVCDHARRRGAWLLVAEALRKLDGQLPPAP